MSDVPNPYAGLSRRWTRRESATYVGVPMLLVSPLAAIEARIFFGERLTVIQIVGFAVALGGVLVARRAAGSTEAVRTGRPTKERRPGPRRRAGGTPKSGKLSDK